MHFSLDRCGMTVLWASQTSFIEVFSIFELCWSSFQEFVVWMHFPDLFGSFLAFLSFHGSIFKLFRLNALPRPVCLDFLAFLGFFGQVLKHFSHKLPSQTKLLEFFGFLSQTFKRFSSKCAFQTFSVKFLVQFSSNCRLNVLPTPFWCHFLAFSGFSVQLWSFFLKFLFLHRF